MQTLILEAKEVMCRWTLPESDQLAVLGLPAGTDLDQLDTLSDEARSRLIARCACITSLNRALNVLYPSQLLATRWVFQPNSHEFFRQQRPLDLLKTGDLETLQRISRMMLAWSAGNG